MAEFWKLLAFILVPVILIALGMIFFGIGSPDVDGIAPRRTAPYGELETPSALYLAKR